MFTRRMSGLWGVVSSAVMAILVVSILVLFELPPLVIWSGSLLVGLFFILQLISAIRGSVKRSSNFSTFEHNALGNPATEAFQVPYHSPIPFESTESVLVWCAPVMQVASGFGDLFKGGARSFLRKGKTMDAENALVLTSKRLLFVMIGPDLLRRFSTSSKVTNLLQNLPGDASAKRRMLWQVGAQEVREALAGLLATESLENLAQSHYSFTIPLSHIEAVRHSTEKRTLKLQLDGLNLNYCFKSKDDLTTMIAEMAKRGL